MKFLRMIAFVRVVCPMSVVRLSAGREHVGSSPGRPPPPATAFSMAGRP